jgi:hypothetical protein
MNSEPPAGRSIQRWMMSHDFQHISHVQSTAAFFAQAPDGHWGMSGEKDQPLLKILPKKVGLYRKDKENKGNRYQAGYIRSNNHPASERTVTTVPACKNSSNGT